VIRKPYEQLGKTLLAWLNDGGETADASDFLERAVDPMATVDDLRALHIEVKRAGLLGAAVEDAIGDPTSLGDLITNLGRAAQAREQQEARARAAATNADTPEAAQ
jgi:hypothetical protein